MLRTIFKDQVDAEEYDYDVPLSGSYLRPASAALRTAKALKGGKMNDRATEFVRLLGRAAFKLWADLPRDVQETLFETAVPDDDAVRYSLAVFLHEHHPRTAHPPKPTLMA